MRETIFMKVSINSVTFIRDSGTIRFVVLGFRFFVMLIMGNSSNNGNFKLYAWYVYVFRI